MKNLSLFRVPLAIAGIFAIGFFLMFVGLFVEDPKPKFPQIPDFNFKDQPERPNIPRFGEDSGR